MKKYVLAIFILASTYISAGEFGDEGYITVTNGYRLDRITTNLKAFDNPHVLAVSKRLKCSNINIYEVGVSGRAEVCQWLVKGYADYGWVFGGRYKDKTIFPDSDVSVGHINNGHTQNYSVGLGYMFYCIDWFNIGPIAGYSYDDEKIQMSKISTNKINNPTLNGLSYKTNWRGPWLGFETNSWINHVNLIMGYEYHWSQWKGDWQLRGPDVPGVAFSDKRKSNRAHGNVVYIESKYLMCDCWEIGFGFKYQYFKANSGRVSPSAGSFSDVGLENIEVAKITKETWTSYQFQLSLGYYF
jgi:hypothetical protein